MKQRTGLAAVLGAVLLASCAGLAQGQPPANEGVKVAAVVNGVQITMADVEAAARMAGPIPPNLPNDQRHMRMIQGLGMIIDNMLMRQFLEKHAAPVNPAEVDKRLADIEAGLKEQRKSMAEFLHDSNRTLEQIKADIADFLRWSAYTASKVSDADVERFYKENKDVFDKVSVRASHIMLPFPQNASEADKASLRAKLQEIRMMLQNDPKADFAELAKQYSKDPQARPGGDLGWFPRKWVFEENFSRVAFSLRVGQVSDIVETQFGYHLIKVTDRKPGEPSDFSKIKPAVREFYIEDLHQEIMASLQKTMKIELIGLK